MLMLTPTELALEFVKRINAHDVDKLCDLMAENHIFIDALGQGFTGREAMRKNWNGYFELFPDYKIVLTDVFQQGHTIGLFGLVSGTFAVNGELDTKNHWEIPAAWKATAQGDQMTEWRVYADNDPARKIMASYQFS
jgi:ketosteroid isomerase-like protein